MESKVLAFFYIFSFCILFIFCSAKGMQNNGLHLIYNLL